MTEQIMGMETSTGTDEDALFDEFDTLFYGKSRIAATCCALTFLLPILTGALYIALVDGAHVRKDQANAIFAILALVPVVFIMWVVNTIKALHLFSLNHNQIPKETDCPLS